MTARAALNVAYASVVEHATAEQRAEIDASLAMSTDEHLERQNGDRLAAILAAGGQVAMP